MGDFKTRTARERTSLSSANPVCFTLWFPCRRFSALPFDPCLMRVLDHQYSNCITWKKKEAKNSSLFSSLFFTMQPKSIVNAKLRDALPRLLSSLPVGDSRLKILPKFISDVVRTYYGIIIIPPPHWSVHLRSSFSLALFFFFLLPLSCFPTDWFKCSCFYTAYSIQPAHMNEKDIL